MSNLPPPPVPADADLTHFDDMPLEVRRLRDSGIAGVADAEVFRCGVLTWCVAWHQLPAGSLPNDDAELCRLVGLGRDLKTWKRIKAGALRGWREFSDGRLYHKVVAEKVIEGWNRSRLKKWSNECDRIRKENKARGERREDPLEFDPKPDKIPFDWPPDSAWNSEGSSVGIPAEKRLNRREGNRRESMGSAAAADSETPTARAQADAVPAESAPTGGEQSAASEGQRRPPDGPQVAMSDHALVDEAYALWLPVAYELRIPDVGHLNRDRRAALRERLAEIGGIEGWKLFLEKVRSAEFLREPDGHPKFWVGLSKLLEPEHFSKLLEDRYAERHRPTTDLRSDQGGLQHGGVSPETAGIAAAFARRSVQS